MQRSQHDKVTLTLSGFIKQLKMLRGSIEFQRYAYSKPITYFALLIGYKELLNLALIEKKKRGIRERISIERIDEKLTCKNKFISLFKSFERYAAEKKLSDKRIADLQYQKLLRK